MGVWKRVGYVTNNECIKRDRNYEKRRKKELELREYVVQKQKLLISEQRWR